MQNQLPVLIVGAGPTGLTAAIELARFGIKCRIIDKAASKSQYSRAIALQARTLEYFEHIGIAGRFLQSGKKITSGEAFSDGRKLIEFDYAPLDTQYPFVMSIPQSSTDEILEQHAKLLGVEVEREMELVSIHETYQAVHARILNHKTKATEDLNAKFIIGADGTNSAVRQLLHLGFTGFSYPQTYAMADVKLEFPPQVRPYTKATFYLKDHNFIGFIPMPNNQYRLMMQGTWVSEHGLDVRELQTALSHCHDWAGMSPMIREASWTARYCVHQRLVNRYQIGRVFLAGDAAHVQSPLAGHGLNSGIQDAVNLCWKIALVENAGARFEILESYHKERHPIAAKLQRMSDSATRMIFSTEFFLRTARERIMPYLFSWFKETISLELSQLNLHYKNSPLSMDCSDFFARAALTLQGGMRVGTRAAEVKLLDTETNEAGRLTELLAASGTNHVVLIVQSNAEKISEIANLCPARLFTVYSLTDGKSAYTALPEDVIALRFLDRHNPYAQIRDGVFIIRPDGYVGLKSHPAKAEHVVAYLERLFEPRSEVFKSKRLLPSAEPVAAEAVPPRQEVSVTAPLASNEVKAEAKAENEGIQNTPDITERVEQQEDHRKVIGDEPAMHVHV